MIKIDTFPVNPLEVNCYVVYDETNEAVIIDPGCFAESEWQEISNHIRKKQLTPTHCLLTHAHFDHIMGCHLVEQDYRLHPEVHADDVALYNILDKQALQFFGIKLRTMPAPTLARCFNEGSTISFGSHTLTVIHTPGHSPGSICYYCPQEKTIFTGDTLFNGSMGRTDLAGGNDQQMQQSLLRLAQLPTNTVAYPGHGLRTTIANEKRWIIASCSP